MFGVVAWLLLLLDRRPINRVEFPAPVVTRREFAAAVARRVEFPAPVVRRVEFGG